MEEIKRLTCSFEVTGLRYEIICAIKLGHGSGRFDNLNDPQHMPHSRNSRCKKNYRDLGEFGATVSEALTLPAVVRWLRNILAISIWSMLFVNIFAINLVGAAVNAFPVFEPIVKYRFLIFLGLVALIFLIFRRRYLFLFVGYIAFFPLVLLLWIIPRSIFRNWVMVLAFWPAIYSFASTFKVSFSLWTVAVVSCFGIALLEVNSLITICMFFLGFYSIIHYGQRIHTAFSPNSGFAALTQMVRHFWSNSLERERSPIKADPDSEEYRAELGQRLVNLYLSTTVLYLMGEKLRAVARTKKLDLYLMCAFVYTFLMTIVVFGFEFYGLDCLGPNNFSVGSETGLLGFIGYSLSTALNAGISPIIPTSLIAQMSSYLELIFMLLLAVLFAFVLFTSARERHRQDLDEVVGEIGEISDGLGRLLLQNHELTRAAADQYLLQVNPLLARWVLRVLYGEERAREIPGFINEESEETGTNEISVEDQKQSK